MLTLYLKLACYNVVVHKTLTIISVSLKCQSIFSCVILHQTCFYRLSNVVFKNVVNPIGATV